MSSVRWLFVDFDGTLVDSLHVARSVYDRFLTEQGGEASDEEFGALNGPSLREIVDRLAERWQLQTGRSELLARYSGLWRTAYATVAPKPGASDFLREAHQRGVPVTIVTSCGHEAIREYLHRHGWEPWIEGTVSGDDVARSKPDPEIYRLALERTRAQPAEGMALEDSINGVRAAAGAGLTTVGISDGSPHSSSPAQLRQAGAIRVIARLGDFFAQAGG